LAGQQVLDSLGLVEQGDHLWQQLSAQCVQPQALAGAIEQLAAGLSLQLGQRCAGRGLRQGQALGGTGNALLARDRGEDLELTQSKMHIYITDKTYFNYLLTEY